MVTHHLDNQHHIPLWIPLRSRIVSYAILGGATGIGYFGTQRFPLYSASTLPETTLDLLIPFSSEWSWMYQTVYIVVAAVALCINRREQHKAFVSGYWFILVVCCTFFWLYPIEAPRPASLSSRTLDSMYSIILSYDGLINCFPSLHVALALYSVAHSIVLIKKRTFSLYCPIACMTVWLSLLCYSTLALKQHYVVDVLAGLALASVAFALFIPRYEND
jgi:membrane-associated phospholipid phosphatase